MKKEHEEDYLKKRGIEIYFYTHRIEALGDIMNEEDAASIVINKAIGIHKNLGPGLLESVYETVLAYELKKQNVAIRRQVKMPLKYKDIVLDKSFVADLVVADKLLVEIKSQEHNHKLHRIQLLTYLRISHKKLGLVLNFGMSLMCEGISRVINKR